MYHRTLPRVASKLCTACDSHSHSLQFRVLAHCPPKDIGSHGSQDGRSSPGYIFEPHAISIVLYELLPRETMIAKMFHPCFFDNLLILLLFYYLLHCEKEKGSRQQTKKIPLMIGRTPSSHSTGYVGQVERRRPKCPTKEMGST